MLAGAAAGAGLVAAPGRVASARPLRDGPTGRADDADLVLLNGNVLTMNDSAPRAEAVAI